MSKTLIAEVGKKNTLRLPPELSADLPEGMKLAVKRGQNGRVTLVPLVAASAPTPSTREAAFVAMERVTEKLSRAADKKGLTEKDIQEAVKRVRARHHDTSRGS